MKRRVVVIPYKRPPSNIRKVNPPPKSKQPSSRLNSLYTPLSAVLKTGQSRETRFISDNAFKKKVKDPLVKQDKEENEEGENEIGDINPFMMDYYSKHGIPPAPPKLVFPTAMIKEITKEEREKFIPPPTAEETYNIVKQLHVDNPVSEYIEPWMFDKNALKIITAVWARRTPRGNCIPRRCW